MINRQTKGDLHHGLQCFRLITSCPFILSYYSNPIKKISHEKTLNMKVKLLVWTSVLSPFIPREWVIPLAHSHKHLNKCSCDSNFLFVSDVIELFLFSLFRRRWPAAPKNGTTREHKCWMFTLFFRKNHRPVSSFSGCLLLLHMSMLIGLTPCFPEEMLICLRWSWPHRFTVETLEMHPDTVIPKIMLPWLLCRGKFSVLQSAAWWH